MKRAAVIGMGDVFPIHLSALMSNPNIKLVGICDIDPSRAHLEPEKIPFFTDYKLMVEETKPDCVHICLPHYLHYEVSKQLIEKGIHVFCEKPLAHNYETALEFVEFTKKHPDVKVGICLQNRYNASVIKLKEFIDSEQYGKVIGAKGLVPWYRPKEYYDVKPWRGKMEFAGGGCMINQSIHTLDLLYYLCGPVKSLKGSCSQILDYDIEVEDTVSVSLNFESGVRGLYWATNANYKNECVQISVQCERGEFLIYDNTLFQIVEGERQFICEDKRVDGSKFYYGASHEILITKFYEMLEGKHNEYTTVEEGLMSVWLIDRIFHSNKEGKSVEI